MHSTRSTLLSLALIAGVNTLASAAHAQQGNASIGLSHSSLHGTTANLGLGLSGLFQTDTDLQLRARAGASGRDGQLALTHRWQRSTGDWRLSFSGGISDWDSAAFATQGLRLEMARTTQTSSGMTVDLGGFAQSDDITSVAVQAAPILARDLGTSTALGLQATVSQDFGDFSDPVPSSARQRFQFGGRASVLGDRRYTALEAEAETQHPLVSSFFFSARLSMGSITAQNGTTVSVLDRAFLGDTAPRGFDFGGLGPRDSASGQALGGSTYYHGSLEVAAPIEQYPVILGGFVDFGSVWNVTGDASTAQSNANALRSSIGVSAEWHGNYGALALSLAQPIQKETGDQSETVSITFNAEF